MARGRHRQSVIGGKTNQGTPRSGELTNRNCMSCERPVACVLAHLPETWLSEASEMLEPLRFAPGQVLWREGICRRGCFIICEGDAILTVRKGQEGKPKILTFLRRGHLIPLVDGAHLDEDSEDFEVQVQAATPLTVRYLAEASFWTLLNRHPAIGIKVAERLSDVVSQLIRELWVSSYGDVECKVATALMELREAGQLQEQFLRQEVIAELAGSSRKAVNQALHKLVQQKIIAIRRHVIRILDERGLQSLAS